MVREIRDANYFSEVDGFVHNVDDLLYLPRLDSQGNDMTERYKQVGFVIVDDHCKLELSVNAKGFEAYMDYKAFNVPEFIRSYHTVIVNEHDEVVMDMFTKRIGMMILEYVCIELIDNGKEVN